MARYIVIFLAILFCLSERWPQWPGYLLLQDWHYWGWFLFTVGVPVPEKFHA